MERAWNGYYPEELERKAQEFGQPTFRGKQLFHFFHQEGKTEIEESTVFSKSLKEKWARLPIRRLHIIKELQSKDGSSKFLLQTDDAAIIESVYMPYEDRVSACISTEIGCKMGCRFCASTKASFVRPLRAEEMCQEIYLMEKEKGKRIDHIVLMGIGEPFDNYQEVVRFLRLITHPLGADKSVRNITLSTCGLVEKIRQFSQENLPINLAISLHATRDNIRKRTMPIANKYSIQEILDACKTYFQETGRRVSLEYTLIQGVNDTGEDLEWMAKNLSGKEFHVNLIPLNEIEEYAGKATGENALEHFRQELIKHGVQATVRQRRGGDIDAACGQLRSQWEKNGEQ